MARYDKYDPKDGGFRAPLAADLAATSKTGNGNPVAVGLDVNGRIVVGGGNTGVVGVLCTTKDMKANDIVDVMTDGEIVEMAGVGAGVVIFGANATAAGPPAVTIGQLSVSNLAGTSVRIGHTVEATRLVVRAAR